MNERNPNQMSMIRRFNLGLAAVFVVVMGMSGALAYQVLNETPAHGVMDL
jgi:hypothetical protein